ncbi:PAAR domain-containing protein [Lonsdalea quercina]|uniref:PAAR domain-containing protein n=1 Tax=Lonsdalea quercina TaxID=71657 RepID=UPI00047A3AA1|nr:PAAR domain-containing protein [Lonsdalea quercina]
MPSAARLGDSCSGHGCFPATPIIQGSSDVIINGKPAARKGDMVLLHACPCPTMPHALHPRSISAGSSNVIINGKAAARVGDAIGCGGSVAAGSGDVIIGDTPHQSPVKSCAEQSASKRSPLLALSPMLLPWKGLMSWMATPELPPPTEALTLEQRKARYQARKQLAQQASTNPNLQAAAKRLAGNNDSILRAEAAKYVYDVDEFRRGAKAELPAPPVGLSIVNPEQMLSKESNPYFNKESGFGAALFKSDINGETMLTFRGTDNAVTGVEDWTTNALQGLGLKSTAYEQAMLAARVAKSSLPNESLKMVGHSLGGGLASAGVSVTKLPGYTFNAAGLHANTVARAGGASLEETAALIKTQAVDGEVLTMAQTYGKAAVPGLLALGGSLIGGLLGGGTMGAMVGAACGMMELYKGALPKAVGEMSSLPSLGGSPIARHGMDQVIAGIETQKREDISAISGVFKET